MRRRGTCACTRPLSRFPSPADDHLEGRSTQPHLGASAETFVVRVAAIRCRAGIRDGRPALVIAARSALGTIVSRRDGELR
jgi:hypothetical protein